MTRTGVTVGRLASVFLVVGGLSTIGWLLWHRTGELIPQPPLLGALLLGLLVIVVLVVAWPVRAKVRGTAKKHLDPLRATRAVVFAQAGALTGAALAGWYAAQLAVVVANLDLVIYHSRAWQILLLALASLLLAGAGLWAQSWCRIDRSNDGDHGQDATSGKDKGRPASS